MVHAERKVRFIAEIARERTSANVKVFHTADSASHSVEGCQMVVMRVFECNPLSSRVSSSTSSDWEVRGDGSRREYSGKGIFQLQWVGRYSLVLAL